MAQSLNGHEFVREFSKVVITLENVLIPPDKLSPTPSMQDGLDLDTEIDLRILGCELIQSAGVLLKLPQVAMATGQLLFQRFFYSKSFVKHNMEVLAMACINLASKIEEAPRRIRDVINVFHHIKQIRYEKPIQPLILDQHYINLKSQVIKAERRVLKELGFCVHVKHPNKIIVMYLQVLECEHNRKLGQYAWNYMNDSFRTDVFMQYHPETIACACIYLAARQIQVSLPDNPPWYSLFNVDEDEIRGICLAILRLYARPKPNFDEMEKTVNNAKRLQMEAKLKAKGLQSDYGTPNSGSRCNTPKDISPAPAGVKKVKQEDDKATDSAGSDKRSHNHSSSKKRSHSRSNDRSSRSCSRSSRSSRSRSPTNKHRHRNSPRKYRKDKERSGRKHEKERYQLSPVEVKRSVKDVKKPKRHKRVHSDESDEVDQVPEKKRSGHKKHKDKAKDKNKDKVHYISKDSDTERLKVSQRHKNGHSPSRDHSEKYDKNEKYEKYEKYDKYERYDRPERYDKYDKYEKHRR